MTKQEVIKTLKSKNGDIFIGDTFSIDKVIAIIESIDNVDNVSNTLQMMYDTIKVEFSDELESRLGFGSLVHYDNMNVEVGGGNKIEVSGVEVNNEKMLKMLDEILTEQLTLANND